MLDERAEKENNSGMVTENIEKPQSLTKEKEALKDRIRSFLEHNTVYNLIHTNSNITVIDEFLSIMDLVEILGENDTQKCLCWNKQKQSIQGIVLIVDLLNMMLQMDPTKLAGEKLPDGNVDLDGMRKNAKESLEKITIGELRYNFKTFKNISMQNLVTAKITDDLYMGLRKMQEKKVGHLIVIDKDINNPISIVSKKQFLLFVIRNFTMDIVRDKMLEKPIFQIEIGVSGSKIYQMEGSSSLRQVFQAMAEKKLSCVPIKNKLGVYTGVVQKWQIEKIFKSLSFEYLNYPVSKFLEYLRKEHTMDPFEGVARIEKEDLFRDVLQKFIFSRGQAIYLDKEGHLKGLISINDIINYLI